MRAISHAQRGEDAESRDMLRQLTVALGLPDHIAVGDRSHGTFEQVFRSMDTDNDREISFVEFQKYLTRANVPVTAMSRVSEGEEQEAGDETGVEETKRGAP